MSVDLTKKPDIIDVALKGSVEDKKVWFTEYVRGGIGNPRIIGFSYYEGEKSVSDVERKLMVESYNTKRIARTPVNSKIPPSMSVRKGKWTTFYRRAM